MAKRLFGKICVEYNMPVGREMEKLLKIPIVRYEILTRENFKPLLAMLAFDGRKASL